MICASKKESYHNNTRKKSEFHVTCRDRVYDIQSFLNYHPGGKNKLVRFQDQVLDSELAKYPHSKSAYYLLEEFAVQYQERYNECEVSDMQILVWEIINRWHSYAYCLQKCCLKYCFSRPIFQLLLTSLKGP